MAAGDASDVWWNMTHCWLTSEIVYPTLCYSVFKDLVYLGSVVIRAF